MIEKSNNNREYLLRALPGAIDKITDESKYDWRAAKIILDKFHPNVNALDICWDVPCLKPADTPTQRVEWITIAMLKGHLPPSVARCMLEVLNRADSDEKAAEFIHTIKRIIVDGTAVTYT
jgi:hypothetical protein